MKKIKFVALSAILALASGSILASNKLNNCDIEQHNLTTNTREVFEDLLIFKAPSSFNADPGQVYEDKTWYTLTKEDKDANQKEVISITAYRDSLIPANKNTYLVDRVKSVAQTCSTSFSTFNLPETKVLGDEAQSAVWKCGTSGGLRRKTYSVVMASRTFEKDGVFYELSWMKYAAPSKDPLTEKDKNEAIEMLNTISPYYACKNDVADKDFYKKCIAKSKK